MPGWFVAALGSLDLLWAAALTVGLRRVDRELRELLELAEEISAEEERLRAGHGNGL